MTKKPEKPKDPIFHDVEWKTIFPRAKGDAGGGKNKFTRLSPTLAMTLDFEKNIQRTMEWLIRFGRRADIQRNDDCNLTYIGDKWFASEIEHEAGIYYHVCDPVKFFQYHDTYAYHYNRFANTPRRIYMSDNTLNAARDMLWSMWNCVGKNFRFAEHIPPWMVQNEGEFTVVAEEIREREGGKFYSGPVKSIRESSPFRCTRCPEELPKRIRAMQMIKKVME